MENVPEVVGKNNIAHFKKWEEQLRNFGYSNYVETLNGKNYGIPQNRKRTFMISILGDYAYDFPCKMPLKYKLKDLLEKEVDEKYYLSQKMIDYISATGPKDFSVNNSKINCSIGRPLTTEQSKRAGTTNYICDDLPNDFDLRNIAIKNATEQGYLLAEDGDGIEISTRMETHRVTVQKGSCQNLTTQGGENVGVVVKDDKDN